MDDPRLIITKQREGFYKIELVKGAERAPVTGWWNPHEAEKHASDLALLLGIQWSWHAVLSQETRKAIFDAAEAHGVSQERVKQLMLDEFRGLDATTNLTEAEAARLITELIPANATVSPTPAVASGPTTHTIPADADPAGTKGDHHEQPNPDPNGSQVLDPGASGSGAGDPAPAVRPATPKKRSAKRAVAS